MCVCTFILNHSAQFTEQTCDCHKHMLNQVIEIEVKMLFSVLLKVLRERK